MLHHTGDTCLQTLLLARQTSQEGALGVVAERAAQGIAHVIAEGSDARHLRDISFQSE